MHAVTNTLPTDIYHAHNMHIKSLFAHCLFDKGYPLLHRLLVRWFSEVSRHSSRMPALLVKQA
jgi:hypothetical protein